MVTPDGTNFQSHECKEEYVYSPNNSNGSIQPEFPRRNHFNSATPNNDLGPQAPMAAPSRSAGQCAENASFINQILAKLPREDMTRLSATMEPVMLSHRESLNGVENGDCFIYFPQGAVVSQIYVLKDGNTAEVALVGSEGMVGLDFLFNSYTPDRWACVALAGSALRMRAKDFKKEFERSGALQQLLLDYAGDYVEQVSQRAVCNSQHRIEERFASWLAMMHDRAGRDLLFLTQEQIAYRLGTRRSSITLAAMALQDQHIISYVRGRIFILDRPALEMAACECYRAIGKRKGGRIQPDAGLTPAASRPVSLV